MRNCGRQFEKQSHTHGYKYGTAHTYTHTHTHTHIHNKIMRECIWMSSDLIGFFKQHLHELSPEVVEEGGAESNVGWVVVIQTAPR